MNQIESIESTYGTKYDYLSVMHYGSQSFLNETLNNTELTIETKDKKYQNLIGNRATFTASDMNYINILYSYNQDDIHSCFCNSFDISGFDTSGYQSSKNGHYVFRNTTLNERKCFNDNSIIYFCYFTKTTFFIEDFD